MVTPFRCVCLMAVAALLTIGCGDSSPRTGSLQGTIALEGVEGSWEGSFVSVGTTATTTRADGTYTLEGVAPGKVTVRAVHEGFVVDQREVAVPDGKAARADFQLVRTNVAPVVSALSLAAAQLPPAGSAALLASASDADGDALTFSWSADHGFTVTPGEGGAATLTAPDTYATLGTVTVTVADDHNGSASAHLQVSTQGNRAPVLSALSATPASVAPGQSLTLAASAADPDGADLTYAWTVPAGWTLSGSGASVQLQAPAQYGQSGAVTLEVRDPGGETAKGQLTVGTAADRAPVVSSVSATPVTVQKGGTLTVHASATDPDGDLLTFTWSAPAGWTLTADGDSATVVAPATAGQSAVLQVVADDGFGQTAQGSVTVGTSTNAPPTIASLVAAPANLWPGASLTLSASASDPDADPLSFSWSVDDPAWSVSGTGATAVAVSPPGTFSSATVTLTVEDGQGGVATATLPVSTGNACMAATLAVSPVSSESMFASDDFPVAQTLKPASGFTLQAVALPLYTCKSNGLVDARLRLTATDAEGAPDLGAVLATFPLVPNAQIPGACSGGDYYEDLTFLLPSPLFLSAGTSYALVLDSPPSPGATGFNGLYWRRTSTSTDPGDLYAGGMTYEQSSVNWLSDPGIDTGFALYGAHCTVAP